MISFKEVYYSDISPKNKEILLVADIGGTNSNFGICAWMENRWQLIFSIHIKSKEIIDFPLTLRDLLAHINNKHQMAVKHICVAGAGPVSANYDYCKPTNLPFEIDATISKTCAKFLVL